ncbi:hypothetical protein FHR72_001074 [Mycolicibacterium iranicum]|uniref:Uncharacterized protein n=1 Tax=Mycolicibacterium iranicum TaxID=912594 RepID=A0A839QAM3_MYCIR|nr:hypothetical protein [Mycolicibacterium iranicum]MBB2989611.1 hypothetical protein [Mycolicibacterium iranicum]
MESTDLFSHTQAPQTAHHGNSSNEPVQAPVFSDAPHGKTPPRDSPAM